MTDISEEAAAELIAFLNGAGPLDGVWFGDKHPTEKGAFWWRKRIEVLSEINDLRAEVTRLTGLLAAAEADKGRAVEAFVGTASGASQLIGINANMAAKEMLDKWVRAIRALPAPRAAAALDREAAELPWVRGLLTVLDKAHAHLAESMYSLDEEMADDIQAALAAVPVSK